MKELDEKRQQYKMLEDLQKSSGWELLYEQMTIRVIADQLRLVDPPDQVSSTMRDYLAGKVKGMSDTANLLSVLLEGLKSEIEMLIEQEKQNGPAERKPDAADTSASTDDQLAGASRSDPFAGQPPS